MAEEMSFMQKMLVNAEEKLAELTKLATEQKRQMDATNLEINQIRSFLTEFKPRQIVKVPCDVKIPRRKLPPEEVHEYINNGAKYILSKKCVTKVLTDLPEEFETNMLQTMICQNDPGVDTVSESSKYAYTRGYILFFLEKKAIKRLSKGKYQVLMRPTMIKPTEDDTRVYHVNGVTTTEKPEERSYGQ